MTGKVSQDVQWYIADTGNMLSGSLIILSLILVRNKTKPYQIALLAVFTISIIDLIHYWVCYKQNELIIFLEGLIMLITALYINLKKWAIR